MDSGHLIPNLFRTEYRKIVSVLCSYLGWGSLEVAEDITSETFLAAVEIWSSKGTPQNPTAWLYAVAKNKTKNHLRHRSFVHEKGNTEIRYRSEETEEPDLDLSPRNIEDSQLAMMFTICNPGLPVESQVSLALNLLCGFGAREIADAFLTNTEVVYKRISRAKEKLKAEHLKISQPSPEQIGERLDAVLKILYLLFSEGYYSTSSNTILRRDLCHEAMLLTTMLATNPMTGTPPVNALLSLMCFHSSRFDARINHAGEPVLYEDQDTNLWNNELVERGEYYLNKAATGNKLSKYHLEAAIAYWHTQKDDSQEKWENILSYYNQLLVMEYSPVAALNRTYALSMVYDNHKALSEALKLDLHDNPLYHALLGRLYQDIDRDKAIGCFERSIILAKTDGERSMLQKNLERLR